VTYGYYPGCSLHSTGAEYDASFRAVCARIGVDLAEIEGWTCCGSSAAHAASHLLSVALPIRNLVRAEERGLASVLVPCAACFSRFKTAAHDVARDPVLARDVEEVIGRSYEASAKILHPLEILAERLADLAARKTRDLSHLRPVAYYGCLLTRPPDVMQFDDCEYPLSMDKVLRAVGIETLDWSAKTDCCGAALSLSETEVVLDLTRAILEEAKAAGANAIAVACPLCHVNLDARQPEVDAKFGTAFGIPIFYFTQLVALALGAAPAEVGLSRHLVDPRPLLAMAG
jgi:heterodisulfide reductase subunit B2